MISQLGQIDKDQILQAKGKSYEVGQLLADYELGKAMQEGSFVTVHLAPTNYHRVHMPFDGTLVETIYMCQDSYSRSITRPLKRNYRFVCP